ncbi:MAG: recombination-mediator protein, partial [Solirubrobacteraceae bacterium]|nr:recombination-mediator protein [Solirubrobacteraceae bacterium]
EAGPRSGARIEARHAADHGRPVYVPRRLLEHEAWVRDFAAARGAVVVIDDAADVLADLAQRRTPTAPTSPPPPPAAGHQLRFEEGE